MKKTVFIILALFSVVLSGQISEKNTTIPFLCDSLRLEYEPDHLDLLFFALIELHGEKAIEVFYKYGLQDNPSCIKAERILLKCTDKNK